MYHPPLPTRHGLLFARKSESSAKRQITQNSFQISYTNVLNLLDDEGRVQTATERARGNGHRS